MQVTASVAVALTSNTLDPGCSHTILSLRPLSLPITSGLMRTLSALLAGKTVNSAALAASAKLEVILTHKRAHMQFIPWITR